MNVKNGMVEGRVLEKSAYSNGLLTTKRIKRKRNARGNLLMYRK